MRSLFKYLALAFLLIAGMARPALGHSRCDMAGGVRFADHDLTSLVR